MKKIKLAIEVLKLLGYIDTYHIKSDNCIEISNIMFDFDTSDKQIIRLILGKKLQEFYDCGDKRYKIFYKIQK